MSDTWVYMAVTDQTPTTSKARRPRLQVIVSERTVAEVQALAEKRGTSVSACAAWIIDEYFRLNPVQTGESPKESPEDGEMMKMLKLMKLAKESGLL